MLPQGSVEQLHYLAKKKEQAGLMRLVVIWKRTPAELGLMKEGLRIGGADYLIMNLMQENHSDNT